MLHRTVATLALLGVLAFAGNASADILASPDATKICAGYDGGGISWSIGLNEGWRPSSLIAYRVVLHDPAGRIVDSTESTRLGGGWLGPYPYWDNGRVTRDPVLGTNVLPGPTPGIYTFTLQIRVDPRYPDITAVGQKDFDWPKHAGRWVTRTWHIHAYDCR
jgi:hypothetical protein